MTELLSREEYAAIAATLDLPQRAFIDGGFRDACGGRTFASTNPGHRRAAGAGRRLRRGGRRARRGQRAAGVRGRPLALAHARRAQGGRCCAWAELLEEHLLELAVMESLDSGKPIRECQHTDLPETINTLRWHAELIDKIYDSTAPVGSAALAMVVREPIGVVGLVLPWNFPLLMLAWKIGPALAAGCSVVVKPAPETSLTALRVAELASQAGIPAGVFNVVPGGGREAGEPLGRHPDVAMVSFTGSTATGRLFLKYAAESNLKRVVLECGGKNPAVVMNDVEDLDLVAQHVVNGAFWNMGENCSASSRLIVHAEVREALLERIGAQLREWRMGDPLDPRNRLGALVSPAHFEKVRAYLDQARTERLAVRFGGATEAGIFVEPTVVDGVSPHSRLFREEIFGPLLSVTSFDDIDEAIALANDTVYGLAASAYTGSLRHALRLSREIRAGIVTVNCFGEGDASTPFGGYKESGFGGRDKSVWHTTSTQS
ncbi:aldehyde dehydrogenase [Pseudomonas aeruginosa]|nr:aldehyde dehydrogenase [Pseudomonas aeruginosa]